MGHEHRCGYTEPPDLALRILWGLDAWGARIRFDWTRDSLAIEHLPTDAHNISTFDMLKRHRDAIKRLLSSGYNHCPECGQAWGHTYLGAAQ